jgi:hypothetical protein
MNKIIPSGPEFAKEAIIVMGGALLAALVLSQFPKVRAFIQNNIGNGPCDCTTH